MLIEIIDILLIVVGVCASFLIGYVTRIHFEKSELKTARSELQRSIAIISVQTTELTQAQAALHDINEKYIVWKDTLSALVQSSVHGILTTDTQKRIRHFNKHFCEMWAIPEEEIYVGAKIHDVLKHCMNKTLESEIFYLNHHKVNFSRDMIWNAENHLLDGKIFQSSSSPVRGVDGTYYGRIWEFFDLTEHTRREQALSQAYIHLESKNSELKAIQTKIIYQNTILTVLQEHLTGAFCVVNESNRIISFNQKHLDQWGISRENLEKSNAWEYVNKAFELFPDPDAQRALFEEVSNDKTRSLHDDVVLADGTTLERHSTPLIDQNGVYHGRIWEFIDITERIQREQSLHDAYSTIEAQYEELAATEEALRYQYSVIKETESDLKEKNSLFFALLDASVHGIIIIDSDIRVHHSNKRFSELWCLPEDVVHPGADGHEILSHCMKRVNDPDQFMSNAQMMVNSRDMTWNDQTYLSDGRIFQTTSSPVYGDHGTYYGRLWEFIDITERIQREQSLHDAYSTIEAQYEELAATEEALRYQYSVIKETESDLKEKNSLFFALLDASVHGIIIIDSDIRVHHSNKRFSELWCLPEDVVHPGADGHEILSHCMKRVNDPDQFMSNAQMILNSRDMTWNGQTYLSDGRIFQTTSSPVYGDDGTYYGKIWEMTDITEDVQREQELKCAYSNIQAQNENLVATEEALRHHYSVLKETETELIRQNSVLLTLQEHLAGGLCVLDENRNLLTFNQKFLDQWKFSREELEQNRNWEFITRCFELYSDGEEAHVIVENVERNRTLCSHNEVVLIDGTVLEQHSTPIIDEDGVYHGTLWEFIDITERIQREQSLHDAYSTIEAQYEELAATEEALRYQYSVIKEAEHDLEEKNNLLSALLEASVQGIITIGSDWRVRHFNKQFCKIWDIPEEVVYLGADGHEILSHCMKRANDPDQFMSNIHAIIDSKANTWDDEIYLSNGKIFQVTSSLVYGFDDAYYGRLWKFIDITERKQYENHLCLTTQKMGVLSQITRHDIMEQLGNVFVISDHISDEVSDVHIKELLKHMEQGLNTVRNQIEFSRNYQELGLHGTEWQDMNGCIKRVTSLLIQPPVEVLANNLPMILADPLLEKAVYRLIENSLRHGKHVTQIKVTFSVEDDGHGILIFEDNGVGIPDEYKLRIFDNDFRKIPDLFLIREIFSLTRMTIHECGQPGQGAQFKITIPSGYWKWE